MRAWPALLLLALGLAGPAAADDGDRAAARAVIAKQEQALGRDDAQTAYEQAAPAIRALFPNADLFIGMVRNQYGPVYRHRSFVFGEARDTGADSVVQSVAIQDAYGVDWTAEYSLVRDADGQWRITGCRLIKAPGTSA
ncbi:DUF4864 domain-containing protein [Methylobacterium sp. J-070]|uniref:DUF4864 domain-containing protein n=1 Tax=Methylobacterium sp. J-070 TaxID=2836650 RepID=UPI001FB9F1BE|nr:DUF4864 domain-containing protein [Methylobacterium sp. J-070]MCJ2048890.1 DUF4864 domain-containing protein [Methylobacterium sp. J-070]